jgi:glycosyltransferase involved in cell wall biosynthesis
MRILFLNHNVVRKGGTFFRAYHVGRFLVRAGHSVTLLTISADRRFRFGREISEGVELVYTPDWLWGVGRTGWDPFDTLSRILYLRAQRWDIVHAWDCRPVVILPALHARRSSSACDGKLIIDWCDWWGRGGTQAERAGRFARLLYGRVETFFEEGFRTRADGTTVASRALRERAVALGVPPQSVTMLPGGSDTEVVKPLPMAEARLRLGIDTDEWIVGYLGVLPIKEAELMRQALVIARSAIPKLRLIAIGVSIAGSPLPFRAVMADSWGAWITDIGRIPFDRVGVYLSACDALLLPMRQNLSNRARWPSKVNDYLAAGRPIVATPVGEVEPLLQHGIGVAVEDNPESIADGLRHLARNRAEAEQSGHRGRALAEGELNWSRVVARLEAFYRRVHSGYADYSESTEQLKSL